MTRIKYKSFQRNFLLAMLAYLVVVLLVWPLARTVPSLPLKVLCALAPIVPLAVAMGLMARRILHSDELEQRTHLVGLGVASGVVALFSTVGGFLASAKLLSLDACANLLLWLFPVLMVSYGVARLWVARRYGIAAGCDDEDETFPTYQRLLGAAGLLGICTAWGYYKSIDSFHLGLLSGTCAGLAVSGALLGLLHWRRRRGSHE
ncbi:MAG TPA: hypothetical protein VFN13_12320 [Rudaea sp.]|nr:hypothetical protein [Rudaea sp.]